ncbi:rhodanese-like domain-containing protein [Halocatena halophila]|uniref:rhodanese-like domain-containing protein n=1 Tax=Halocatena halophila TaxID=2814576 RepID=UPI002ED68F17
MNGRTLSRRRLLAATGTSVVVGLAGCLKPNNSDGGTDGGGGDGYAPETVTDAGTNTTTNASTETTTSGDVPAEPTAAAVNGYQSKLESGVEVPLAPIDHVYKWYQNRAIRVVDARGAKQYGKSHIAGAVHSPAEDGKSNNDPAEQWPKDAWIVTYCACPHHLSSMRAASLINQGYEHVMALDEGYLEWQERNYPLEGSDVDQQANVRTIIGETAAKFAGEKAWAFHRDSGQKEVTDIDQDGSYKLDLPFYDVTDDSLIEIETPAYTVEKPLGELTTGTLTTSGTLRVGTR